MRILMVATNPDFTTKEGGTSTSRNKLISLLSSHNELVFLNAVPPKKKEQYPGPSVIHIIELGKSYSFRQQYIFGKCLAMFTDFHPVFLWTVMKIIRKEKIDAAIVTEPYGLTMASLLCPGVPFLYDAHDFVSEHAEIAFERLKLDFAVARMPVVGGVLHFLFKSYLHTLEKMACRKAAHTLAITELDRKRFMQRYGMDGGKVTAIPVYTAVNTALRRENEPPGKKGQINIIFHGIYGHPANYEAFELIKSYIAPEVWKHNRDVRFLLAGTDVPQFEENNVQSLGYVRDLDSLLAKADIAVVPILQGTGVRMKILDYMAAGLPVITTQAGIDGIDAENGKHAIILDAVDEKFVQAILRLADDANSRAELGRSGVALIARDYNRETVLARLDEALAKLK